MYLHYLLEFIWTVIFFLLFRGRILRLGFPIKPYAQWMFWPQIVFLSLYLVWYSCYSLYGAISFGILTNITLIIPLCWPFLVQFIYELRSFQRDSLEIEKDRKKQQNEENDLLNRQEAQNAIWEDLVVLKTYLDGSQSFEYLQDRRKLETAGIAFTSRQTFLTTLLVTPKDLEQACVLLDISPEISEAGQSETIQN